MRLNGCWSPISGQLHSDSGRMLAPEPLWPRMMTSPGTSAASFSNDDRSQRSVSSPLSVASAAGSPCARAASSGRRWDDAAALTRRLLRADMPPAATGEVGLFMPESS